MMLKKKKEIVYSLIVFIKYEWLLFYIYILNTYIAFYSFFIVNFHFVECSRYNLFYDYFKLNKLKKFRKTLIFKCSNIFCVCYFNIYIWLLSDGVWIVWYNKVVTYHLYNSPKNKYRKRCTAVHINPILMKL